MSENGINNPMENKEESRYYTMVAFGDPLQEVETRCFATVGEKEAFLEGVRMTVGWQEWELIDEGFKGINEIKNIKKNQMKTFRKFLKSME